MDAVLRTLLIGTAAALGGCVAPSPPPPAAPSAAGLAAMAARLPMVAADFRRGESRPTGRDGAEGREVAYATGGGRSTAAATVELLADDTPAEAALVAALGGIARAGPAREMREAGRFTVPASGGGAAAGPPLQCAETAGRYGRERVVGLVCAGQIGGALLRIRVTMPARQPPPGDARAFAQSIAASLSGPAGTAGSTGAAARPG